MIHTDATDDWEITFWICENTTRAEFARDGLVITEGEDGDFHLFLCGKRAVVADFFAAPQVDCLDNGGFEF